MAQGHLAFEDRVRSIAVQRQRLARGQVHYVGADGLIRARPRRMTPRFPLTALVLVLLGGFAFKAVIFAHLGAEAYAAQVAAFAAGTVAEQAGAWLMQPDPLTVWTAGQADTLLARVAAGG
jgi:hypothetical protein